jgi:hypothetical protein
LTGSTSCVWTPVWHFFFWPCILVLADGWQPADGLCVCILLC